MSKTRFDVTYDIVSAESSERGCVAEAGYVEDGARLRDAVKALHGTRTCQVAGVESVECASWPVISPCAVTVVNGMEFLTGDNESRTLRIPESVTRSTARRIARLCGVDARCFAPLSALKVLP